MSQFSEVEIPMPRNITSRGKWGVGDTDLQSGSNCTDQVWPTANLAIYIPFEVTELFVAKSMFVLNGTTLGGNIMMGIYTQDGRLIASVGGASTAQVNNNALDIIAFASPVSLAPGNYFMALACDSGTAKIYCSTNLRNASAQSGCQQQTSAMPLPSQATFAGFNGVEAMFGISKDTVY
jgi:hypothetical protein